MNRKAELDAADEGGVLELDINYPPHDAPLYWEDFKAWAKVNLPECSLAVVDEQLADPIVAAGLQCFRAGRIAQRDTMPVGKKSDEDFGLGKGEPPHQVQRSGGIGGRQALLRRWTCAKAARLVPLPG